MAKARQCPKCGNWYNPKFGGTAEMCHYCVISQKLKEQNTPTKQ